MELRLQQTPPTHTLARRERRPQQGSGQVATPRSRNLPTSFLPRLLPDGGKEAGFLPISAAGWRGTVHERQKREVKLARKVLSGGTPGFIF